jgi:uncharacterized protein (TIGR03435 family)
MNLSLATVRTSTRVRVALLLLVAAAMSEQAANGQARVTPPRFDVVSVKPSDKFDVPPSIAVPSPGSYVATNVPLRSFIQSVFRIRPYQLIGAPSWTQRERFDIEAKTARAVSPDEFGLMLESILVDRFKMVARRETQQLPVYALLVDKPGRLGPQLRPSADRACPPPSVATSSAAPPCGRLRTQFEAVDGEKVTMEALAFSLGPYFGMPVVDRTDLSGFFDMAMTFTPTFVSSAAVDAAPAGTSIETALREQLGLRIERQQGPVPVVVVERIDRPTPN